MPFEAININLHWYHDGLVKFEVREFPRQSRMCSSRFDILVDGYTSLDWNIISLLSTSPSPWHFVSFHLSHGKHGANSGMMDSSWMINYVQVGGLHVDETSILLVACFLSLDL